MSRVPSALIQTHMSLLASQLCQCQGALTGLFATDSSAVLTYNTLAAHVVDFGTRAVSQSWTVPAGQSLGSAVVQTRSHLWALEAADEGSASRALLRWPATVTRLDSTAASRLEFPHPLIALHAHARLLDNLILIGQAGHVSIVSANSTAKTISAPHTSQASSTHDSDVVLDSQVHAVVSDSAALIITVIRHSAKHGRVLDVWNVVDAAPVCSGSFVLNATDAAAPLALLAESATSNASAAPAPASKSTSRSKKSAPAVVASSVSAVVCEIPLVSFAANWTTRTLSFCFGNGRWAVVSFPSAGSLVTALRAKPKVACIRNISALADAGKSNSVSTPLSSSSLHSFFVGSAAVALIDASSRAISLWETAFGTMLVSQTLEQLSIAQSQPAAAVEELVAAGRGKKRARAAPAATATASSLTLQCVVVPSHSDSTSTAAASVLLIAPDAVHLVKATAPAAPTLASALGRLSSVASLLMPQSDADSSAVASLAHAAPSVTVPVSFDVSSLRGPTGALSLVPPAEMAIDSMWGSTAPQANAANVEEQTALRKLGDSQLSDSDWCSTFEDFVTPSDAKRSKKSTTKTASAASTRSLSWTFVNTSTAALMRRLKATEDDSLYGPLTTLLRSANVNLQVAADGLVDLLIEREQSAILCDCLLHVADVPESDIVSILSYALRAAQVNPKFVKEPESVQAISTVTALSGGRLELPASSADLIALCVSAKRNDVFMLEALTSMSPEQVVTLIDWLFSTATVITSVSESELSTAMSSARRFPSLTQVIEWVCLCVDSHFSAIMGLTAVDGESSVVKHLHGLQTLANTQLALGDKMNAVASLARQLLVSGAAHALPKQAIPVYSIEVFEL